MARGGKIKAKRGGGRNFSRHLTLDEHGTAVAVDRSGKREDESDDDDDDDDEDKEEEEEEESEESEEEPTAAGATASTAQPELSRAERKELKKRSKAVKKDADEDADGEDPLLANPNRAMGNMKISDLNAPREPTRREREAKDKADAQERYWKLHAQGKTEQAKSDLARLAKIRAEREAAQAKRKAEQDAKSAEIESKKAAGSKRNI